MRRLRTVPLHRFFGKCRDRWVLWTITAWALAEITAVTWLVFNH